MKVVDYNHVLLYAKGHYVITNGQYNDIKHIIGIRCGLDDDSVTREHVYNVLLSLLLKYSPNEFVTIDTLLRTFGIKKLLFKDETTDDTAVQNLLSPISHYTVVYKDGKMILNVGEPDCSILPVYVVPERKVEGIESV